ncbi:Homeobox protein araucan [Sarcoptes scabiei]|nr:Homeobox protein araucan [Sarcoptes scabiei]
MVTGGDDAKINLWAIGKPNCIMSLNGHRTSIECAKFNQNEDIVGAGSASGAIKLWDLEAAKLIQTLTGHKTNVRCIDFHPYGHFLASGSFDTSIKLWDYRKKTCIITYKIHSKDVHCLKLSPDGRWLASGGNEGSVMLYDIVAGKMLAELKGHSASVTDVVFHPNEFLLASSSSDGSVKFWDLESFMQVSCSLPEMGAIRKIAFHPEGKSLIASGKDSMKIYGWEPSHLFDTVSTHWGRLNDMAVLDEQLVAGSYSTTNVSVFMVDLTVLQPFNYANRGKSNLYDRDSVLRQSKRRSFDFDQTSKTRKQLESLESTRTDIDDNGSDGIDSLAEIYNACDYREIFQSRRELNRTPPLPVDSSTIANDDQNMRLLQTVKQNQQLSKAFTNKSPHNYANLVRDNRLTNHLPPSSSLQQQQLQQSNRFLSESLNDLCLNQRNNNVIHQSNLSSPTATMTTIPSTLNPNQDLMIKDPNLANNNHILPHSTSLTGLNRLKISVDSHVTFPMISNTVCNENLNESNAKFMCSPSVIQKLNPNQTYPYNHQENDPVSPAVHNKNSGNNSTTSTSSKTVDKQPLSNSSCNTLASNLLPSSVNSNKITSVVRPVVNDSDRPSITTYPVISNQAKSIPNIDHSIASISNQNAAKFVGPLSDHQHVSHSHHHSVDAHNTDTSTMIIPEIRDHPAGLDFNDFLPKHIQQYGIDSQPFISEIETINAIIKGHKATKTGLDYRRKQVQIVMAMWATKDSKTALEYAINLDEKSIIIDILNVMILKPTVWNLDVALILLPCIQELLQSKYESYMSVGCSALSLVLKTFSSTIKNNISAPPGIGVDISREERYNRCMKCYNHLLSARAFVLKRQTLQGKIGRSFRELSILMQNLD